jgi:hypothetical protein
VNDFFFYASIVGAFVLFALLGYAVVDMVTYGYEMRALANG